MMNRYLLCHIMSEDQEIPMYCCLPFSYAVYYGMIKISYERNEVAVSLKSSLSEGQKKGIWDSLYKMHITNVHPDFLHIVHCPWCGLHMNNVVDFDKCHAGAFSSKEGWEK